MLVPSGLSWLFPSNFPGGNLNEDNASALSSFFYRLWSCDAAIGCQRTAASSQWAAVSRGPRFAACDLCGLRPAIYNLRPATRVPRFATCDLRPATRVPRPATCDPRPAACDPRPAAYTVPKVIDTAAFENPPFLTEGLDISWKCAGVLQDRMDLCRTPRFYSYHS